MGDTTNEPKASFNVTYKRADGEEIGDYGWVTDLEYLDEDDEPVRLIREQWARVEVATFWHLPNAMYACAELECDEDAVSWFEPLDGSMPIALCPIHFAEATV